MSILQYRPPRLLARLIGPFLHPIGSLYFTTSSTNPGTSLGFGTWSAFGAGKMFVGFDAGQTEFDTDEETGGSKTHTLDADEIPALTIDTHGADTGSGATSVLRANVASGDTLETSIVNTTGTQGQDHNNLPPYIVVRCWKRTA